MVAAFGNQVDRIAAAPVIRHARHENARRDAGSDDARADEDAAVVYHALRPVVVIVIVLDFVLELQVEPGLELQLTISDDCGIDRDFPIDDHVAGDDTTKLDVDTLDLDTVAAHAVDHDTERQGAVALDADCTHAIGFDTGRAGAVHIVIVEQSADDRLRPRAEQLERQAEQQHIAAVE
jgi:hypothetical protein